jgi:hypothetical protein
MPKLLTLAIGTIILLISCQSHHKPSSAAASVDSSIIRTANTDSKISLDDVLALSANSKPEIGDIKLSFDKFSVGRTFIHDRYDDSWMVHTAERGDKFITSTVTIKAQSKEPSLPCIAVYSYRNGTLYKEADFFYQFYRWQDYGYYLGNYHDKTNDFAYVESVKFGVGGTVSEALLTMPLFVVCSNSTSVSREESKFSTPPVSYSSTGCNEVLKTVLQKDELSNITVIDILNKSKLK